MLQKETLNKSAHPPGWRRSSGVRASRGSGGAGLALHGIPHGQFGKFPTTVLRNEMSIVSITILTLSQTLIAPVRAPVRAGATDSVQITHVVHCSGYGYGTLSGRLRV